MIEQKYIFFSELKIDNIPSLRFDLPKMLGYYFGGVSQRQIIKVCQKWNVRNKIGLHTLFNTNIDYLTLDKTRNFGQKSKFWSKIEILVKNRNFGQKNKIWSNIENLVKI